MPELPEVQTIVNDLKKKILNRRLVGFWSDTPRIFPKNKISNLKNQIKDWRIVTIHRRGKNILLQLARHKPYTLSSKLLVIHPKLTGRLELIKSNKRHETWNKKKYYRAVFYFNDGLALAFRDVRKFGKIIFGDKKKIESLPDLKNLGPDPLTQNFDVSIFRNIIKAEKRKIKLVLLDQEVIAGIGNIYSDEALWQAKIHPFKPSNQLTSRQLTNLYKAIRKVLNSSLSVRGSSLRDFRDTEGKEGGYIKIRKVYSRENLPCYRCGVKIKRIKMGVRSAHLCPKCQKL